MSGISRKQHNEGRPFFELSTTPLEFYRVGEDVSINGRLYPFAYSTIQSTEFPGSSFKGLPMSFGPRYGRESAIDFDFEVKLVQQTANVEREVRRELSGISLVRITTVGRDVVALEARGHDLDFLLDVGDRELSFSYGDIRYRILTARRLSRRRWRLICDLSFSF